MDNRDNDDKKSWKIRYKIIFHQLKIGTYYILQHKLGENISFNVILHI